MIIRTPEIERIPHGNTVIWRYLSLDKFLDLITSRELFFANAAKMTDKYEGLLPKRNQFYLQRELQQSGLTEEEAESQIDEKLAYHNALRALTLINCWNISKHESYALWKIYLGGAKAGVAIKSTVGKLTRALNYGEEKNPEDVFISEVNYTDFIREEAENRFKIITTKNRFYEYENELRLFILHDPLTEGGIRTHYNVSVGRRYGIDIHEMIDEIYMSPFSAGWFDKTITEVIHKIDPRLSERVKQSEILDQ